MSRSARSATACCSTRVHELHRWARHWRDPPCELRVIRLPPRLQRAKSLPALISASGFPQRCSRLARAVKPVNRLVNFYCRVGHNDLDVPFRGKMNFIRLRRIKQFGQRDQQHVAVPVRPAGSSKSVRQSRGWSSAGRRISRSFNYDTTSDAQISRLNVQDVVELHDAEILRNHGSGTHCCA